MPQNAFLGFALVAIKLKIATKIPKLVQKQAVRKKVTLKLCFNKKYSVCSNLIVASVYGILPRAHDQATSSCVQYFINWRSKILI